MDETIGYEIDGIPYCQECVPEISTTQKSSLIRRGGKIWPLKTPVCCQCNREIPIPNKSELSNHIVGELELPVHVREKIVKTLVKHGVKTLDDLTKKTLRDLRRMEGLGEQGLHYLVDALHKKGLSLSATEKGIEIKWEPDSHWDEHPNWSVEDWKNEISNDDTRQGYHEWVRSKIEQMLEEAKE
jgi:hypothetical protein